MREAVDKKAMWTDRESTHIAFSIMLIWVHTSVSSFNRHVTSGRSASSVNSFFLSGSWVGGTDHCRAGVGVPHRAH